MKRRGFLTALLALPPFLLIRSRAKAFSLERDGGHLVYHDGRFHEIPEGGDLPRGIGVEDPPLPVATHCSSTLVAQRPALAGWHVGFFHPTAVSPSVGRMPDRRAAERWLYYAGRQWL